MYASPDGTEDDFHYGLLWTVNGADLWSPTPLVMFFHGAGSTETQPIVASGSLKMLRGFLDAGWNVFSSRLGTTVIDGVSQNDAKWGNQQMRDGIADAFAWLAHIGYVHHSNGALFYGVSHGGTCAVNSLMEVVTDNSYLVAGVALADPALWLRNISQPAVYHEGASPWGSNTTLQHQLRDAYSLANNQVSDPLWAANVDDVDGGHDSCEVDIPTRMPLVPFWLTSSPDDTTVDEDSNSLKFIGILEANGWNGGGGNPTVEHVATTGQHGALSHSDPTAVNAFFTTCLGL